MKDIRDGSTVNTNTLIRLHPNEGGSNVTIDGAFFGKVSPDVFIGLDLFDHSRIHEVTRKLNVVLEINSHDWSAHDFFRFLTQDEAGADPFEKGALTATSKCQIHGNYQTNLHAHMNLMNLLNQPDLKSVDKDHCGFKLNNTNYLFHSIGVAANKDYKPVGSASHFEIKFQRQSANGFPLEQLCLNIHLKPTKNISCKRGDVIKRLRQGIRLFYAELGVLKQAAEPQTRLKEAMQVTLENYSNCKFSCSHEASRKALDTYNETKKYTVRGTDRQKIMPFDAFFKINNQAPASYSDAVGHLPPNKRPAPNNGSGFLCDENDFPPLGQTKMHL